MRIGVFDDGLAHLGLHEALAWCAERGVDRLELAVGGWRPAEHADLDRLLREPAERDRLAGELRAHGVALSCVNAAGNPLHPDASVAADHAGRLRGAVQLAALLGVERVVTMSGSPAGPAGGELPIFAPWALTPDRDDLWAWQLE